MTVKTFAKQASYVAGGVIGVGLLFRYFGDQPILSDAKEGLKGNVKGLFK